MSTTTMTAPVPAAQAPVTEDAFEADRARFWRSFTGMVVGVVIAAVVVLLLMAAFLT